MAEAVAFTGVFSVQYLFSKLCMYFVSLSDIVHLSLCNKRLYQLSGLVATVPGLRELRQSKAHDTTTLFAAILNDTPCEHLHPAVLRWLFWEHNKKSVIVMTDFGERWKNIARLLSAREQSAHLVNGYFREMVDMRIDTYVRLARKNPCSKQSDITEAFDAEVHAAGTGLIIFTCNKYEAPYIGKVNIWLGQNTVWDLLYAIERAYCVGDGIGSFDTIIAQLMNGYNFEPLCKVSLEYTILRNLLGMTIRGGHSVTWIADDDGTSCHFELSNTRTAAIPLDVFCSFLIGGSDLNAARSLLADMLCTPSYHAILLREIGHLTDASNYIGPYKAFPLRQHLSSGRISNLMGSAVLCVPQYIESFDSVRVWTPRGDELHDACGQWMRDSSSGFWQQHQIRKAHIFFRDALVHFKGSSSSELLAQLEDAIAEM